VYTMAIYHAIYQAIYHAIYAGIYPSQRIYFFVYRDIYLCLYHAIHMIDIYHCIQYGIHIDTSHFTAGAARAEDSELFQSFNTGPVYLYIYICML
jgi:hypothetical protein